jgi:hypothetical protein
MPDFRSSPPRCGAAGFAALASLFLLVAPLDQALADKPSTPVTVTNPSTSPALTRSVDDPARHPFVTSCTTSSTGIGATCSTPSIPAGEEVVIETISIRGSAVPGNSALELSVGTTAGQNPQTYGLNSLIDDGTGQPTEAFFQGAQALRLYADPSSVIECTGFTKGANPTTGLGLSCIFSGYSVKLR